MLRMLIPIKGKLHRAKRILASAKPASLTALFWRSNFLNYSGSRYYAIGRAEVILCVDESKLGLRLCLVSAEPAAIE